MEQQAMPSHRPRSRLGLPYPPVEIGPCPATQKHPRMVEWSSFLPAQAAPEARSPGTNTGRETPPDLMTWAKKVSEEIDAALKRSQKVDHRLAKHVWMVQRLFAATDVLSGSVTVDPQVRGGVAVLKGTRMPLSQILAEVSDDRSLSDIAEDKELDLGLLKAFFGAMATYLDRPVTR